MGKQSEKGSKNCSQIDVSKLKEKSKYVLFFIDRTTTLTVLNPNKLKVRIFGSDYCLRNKIITVGKDFELYSGKSKEVSLPVKAIKIHSYSGFRTDKNTGNGGNYGFPR